MALYDNNLYYGEVPLGSATFGNIQFDPSVGKRVPVIAEKAPVVRQDTRSGKWEELRKSGKTQDSAIGKWLTGTDFADAVTEARKEASTEGMYPPNLTSEGILSGMNQFGVTGGEAYPSRINKPTTPPQEAPRDGAPVDTSKGEVITPNPATNPAQHIAASIANRDATKVGTDSRKPNEPAPDTPAVAAQKAAVEQGKRVAFDMNKVPKWNDSKAFNMSLISFGLNLLSGNSYADAFNAAGATFGELYGKEKREAWAEDLRAAGYDEQEIQQYIETGDNKVLTDPMEKQFKQVQMQQAQANLEKTLYENSPEERKYKKDQDAFERQLKLEGIDIQRQGNQLAAARFAWDKQKYAEEQKAKAEAAKHDMKTTLGGMVTGGVTWNDVMEAGAYTPSIADTAKAYAISKLPEDIRDKAYQDQMPKFYKARMTTNKVSEMIGRGLSGAALSETKERPTWANALVPTADEIRRNDVAAITRKQNTFIALQAYAESRADAKPGSGALELRDINAINNGGAQFIIDPAASQRAGKPIPVGIRYNDGSFKKL